MYCMAYMSSTANFFIIYKSDLHGDRLIESQSISIDIHMLCREYLEEVKDKLESSWMTFDLKDPFKAE